MPVGVLQSLQEQLAPETEPLVFRIVCAQIRKYRRLVVEGENDRGDSRLKAHRKNPKTVTARENSRRRAQKLSRMVRFNRAGLPGPLPPRRVQFDQCVEQLPIGSARHRESHLPVSFRLLRCDRNASTIGPRRLRSNTDPGNRKSLCRST